MGTRVIWGLLLVYATSCEAGEPVEPAQLDLRAALLSTPESIASLPLEQRMRLATQMEEAASVQRVSSSLDAASERPSLELLELFDEPRALASNEAIVVLTVARGPASARFETLGFATLDGGTVPEDVTLILLDPELHEELAASLVRGRVRETLERLARATGAREVSLGEAMPTGAMADAERIVVNPVWLMLLVSLDAHDDAGRSSAPLIEPARHHDTESGGFGCYGTVCTSSCGAFSSAGTGCSCARHGCDCGLCATECGPDSDGVHCATARPRPLPSPSSPLDVLWMLAPLAYLLLRRSCAR